MEAWKILDPVMYLNKKGEPDAHLSYKMFALTLPQIQNHFRARYPRTRQNVAGS